MSDAFWTGILIGSLIVLAVAVWFGRREEKRLKEEERKLDEDAKRERERLFALIRRAWRIPGRVQSLPEEPSEGKAFAERHRN